MRFLGNIEAKTDAKGRVFLPVAFRKVLQAEGVEQLVLRKDVHEDCLVLYPDVVWNEQVDRMRQGLNRWNRREQQVFRMFVSEAEAVSMDASGRILLSRRLQEKVGINEAVRLIGVGDTIEIWPMEDEDVPFMDAWEFGDAIEALLGPVDE